MKTTKIKLMTYAALFAAAVYVMTMLSFPMGLGYVHVGDALIMLCASLLPTPYAVAAAAIGGALSDLTLAYTAYIPATFIIKGLIALCYTAKNDKIICKHNIISFVGSIAVTVGGYYITECIIYNSLVSPIASLLPNLLQAVCSIILYAIVGAALDKFNIKKYLHI